MTLFKLFGFEVIDISDRLYDLLIRLLNLAEDRQSKITVVGGGLTFDLPGNVSITTYLSAEESMNRTFTLPDDTPDAPYQLATIDEIKDGEGNVITDFTESFESSDPEVVQLLPGGDRSGQYHIGKPGSALVTHSVTTKVGRNKLVSVVDTSTFVITPGAPLAVTGGGATFEGIEADPVEPTPEPTA